MQLHKQKLTELFKTWKITQNISANEHMKISVITHCDCALIVAYIKRLPWVNIFQSLIVSGIIVNGQLLNSWYHSLIEVIIYTHINGSCGFFPRCSKLRDDPSECDDCKQRDATVDRLCHAICVYLATERAR